MAPNLSLGKALASSTGPLAAITHAGLCLSRMRGNLGYASPDEILFLVLHLVSVYSLGASQDAELNVANTGRVCQSRSPDANGRLSRFRTSVATVTRGDICCFFPSSH